MPMLARIAIAAIALAPALGLAGCRSSTGVELPVFVHPVGDDMQVMSLVGRPHGVATAANGRFAVSLIDLARIAYGETRASSQSLAGWASVGSTPAHVAMNRSGTRAYTTNQYDNSVSVVDLASGQVVATVPLAGNGFNLLVAPDGKRVFATTGNGMLHVIDAETNTSRATLAVGASANGLAYHASSRTLYVSSRDAARITAIDADEEMIIDTYPVSAMPQRIAVSADNTELYIASEVAGLEILDLATGQRTIVPGVASGSVGLAQSPDGAQIWVVSPPRGLLTVVDRALRTVVRTTQLGGSPRNVAFDETGATALIADEMDRLHIIR